MYAEEVVFWVLLSSYASVFVISLAKHKGGGVKNGV